MQVRATNVSGLHRGVVLRGEVLVSQVNVKGTFQGVVESKTPEPRKATTYCVFVMHDTHLMEWIEGVVVEGMTKDQARSRAVKALAVHPDWQTQVMAKGITIEVFPQSSFSPQGFEATFSVRRK